MIIGPAAPSDLDAVVALANAAYRGNEAARGWSHEADYMTGQRTDRATLEADLSAHPAACILLAREAADGPLLGCVWVEVMAADRGYVGMLSVRPDLQAAGLGRQLLTAAEEHLASQGAHRVRMTVIQIRDTLIAWYERRGYCRTGEVEPFPYEDERFGRPLRDDLHFVVLEKALGPQA